MEHDDIADKLFIMNVATVERLFALGADEFLLYSFYYKTAKWQKSTEVWANNEYVMKCLGWGLKKVRTVKENLVKNGFVEQVRVINKDTGKVKKWTIRVKYVQGLSHSGKNDPVDEKTIGAIPPLGQFKGQNNNNNKISKDSLYSNNSTPILRNTIPYGNTITSYCPQGDILGDKRPDGANDLPRPKRSTKPEDYGLVKFDIGSIQFGDWERLMNWFEYNHREKSSGKVMRPYCKRMFKQMVNMAKDFSNGIWFKAVDCIEGAVNNGYQGFGNGEKGFFFKPKSDEDYELELSLAKDFALNPEQLPERVERYRPMVLDLAIKAYNDRIEQLQGLRNKYDGEIAALDPKEPNNAQEIAYLRERIERLDKGILESREKIKRYSDEKNALKMKKVC